jgi:F-box-like/WD domain, G-beta repeat
VSPRLHKDFVLVCPEPLPLASPLIPVQELPHELKYEVLSYLDVRDLTRAMSVSVSWYQICSYPLLWKSLYFQEGWTVAEDAMLDFEDRLRHLQLQFDFQHQLYRSTMTGFPSPGTRVETRREGTTTKPSPKNLIANDRSRVYEQFFSDLEQVLQGDRTYTALQRLRSRLCAIARIEIGDPFFHTVMFSPNSNGSIRLHTDWRYVYVNRNLLENNWRVGRYSAEFLNCPSSGDDSTNPPEGIYCVYFDHQYLATGSRDHSIRLWEKKQSFNFLAQLKDHNGSVLCLQLDSKRNLLVSGSSDSTIKVWDLEGRKIIQTLEGHTESVLGLHFEDSYIVSCSRDSTARIWRLQERIGSFSGPDTVGRGSSAESAPTFVLSHVLRGHRAAVNSVHFKDNIIATASGDRTVRLWNLTSGTTIRTISAHPRGIACVNISGDLVVTGSSDHVIKVFDLLSGEEVRTLRGHSGLVRTIHTDNTKIISGSYDQSIRIWDLQTGDMLKEISGLHDAKYCSCLHCG